MYYQEDVERKERRKIIGIATIAVLLILILLVAIIVVATKKSSKTNIGNNTAVELNTTDDKVVEVDANVEKSESDSAVVEVNSDVKTEANSEQKAENEDNKVGIVSIETNTSDKNTTSRNSTNASATTTAKNTADMPDTGPEEILPIALIAGTFVAYLSSRKLAKRDA